MKAAAHLAAAVESKLAATSAVADQLSAAEYAAFQDAEQLEAAADIEAQVPTSLGPAAEQARADAEQISNAYAQALRRGSLPMR